MHPTKVVQMGEYGLTRFLGMLRVCVWPVLYNKEISGYSVILSSAVLQDLMLGS